MKDAFAKLFRKRTEMSSVRLRIIFTIYNDVTSMFGSI
jgi:hypothetical protein